MEVLLGLKKAGFGCGKYAGIGGKVEPGETVEEAAVREVEEEIGVKVFEKTLQFMGKITFVFPSKPEWGQVVSIFRVISWQGDPFESDEMKPFWFTLDAIPYEAMWQDARHWLPEILDGNKLQGQFTFKDDNETVEEVCLELLPLGENPEVII